MLKLVGTALAAGLVIGLIGGPAAAGRTKTIHREFTAGPNVPMPDSDNGCLSGVEGVQKTTIPFKAPKAGMFTASIHDFQGDWDLFVTDSKGTVLGVDDSSQLTGDPVDETIILRLKAGQKVNIVACNWAGGPTAAGHYMYKYKT